MGYGNVTAEVQNGHLHTEVYIGDLAAGYNTREMLWINQGFLLPQRAGE